MTSARTSARDRRARLAVAALFLTNGAIFASLLPRYPEIKSDLMISNTGFGLSVAAFSAGALLSGPTAGALVRRFTSAHVAVATSLVLAAFTFAASVAPSAALFASAMFVAGAGDAVTDVAQNAHGLRVQRNYRRSIINSLHAVWSVGAVAGGLIGAASIAAGVPRGVQLAGTGLLFGAIALGAHRLLLPGPDRDVPPAGDDSAPAPPRVGPGTLAAVAMLAALAIAGAAVEDSGSSWATLYLHTELGAPAAVAAFGYIALVGFQFLGRLLGDRLVDRFSERSVARAGGLVIAVGMGLALALPGTAGTIAGFAAAGFGVATVIPAAFHAADNLTGLPPGTGLTAVTWLMRSGFLLAPVVVGAIADAAGLRIGLLIVPAAGLVIVGASGVLAGSRRGAPHGTQPHGA